MKLRLLGSSLVLATAAGLPGYGPAAFAQAPAGEPIKIGAVLSVTGVGAGLGVNERNGLILAEKTINAKGGLNGRPIRIIIEDDTSNPDTAVTKVNDLIFNQKVIAIFGGVAARAERRHGRHHRHCQAAAADLHRARTGGRAQSQMRVPPAAAARAQRPRAVRIRPLDQRQEGRRVARYRLRQRGRCASSTTSPATTRTSSSSASRNTRWRRPTRPRRPPSSGRRSRTRSS